MTNRIMKTESEIRERLEKVERNFDGDSAILGARIDTLRWVLEDGPTDIDTEKKQERLKELIDSTPTNEATDDLFTDNENNHMSESNSTETVTGEVIQTYQSRSDLPYHLRKSGLFKEGTYKLVRVSEPEN